MLKFNVKIFQYFLFPLNFNDWEYPGRTFYIENYCNKLFYEVKKPLKYFYS